MKSSALTELLMVLAGFLAGFEIILLILLSTVYYLGIRY